MQVADEQNRNTLTKDAAAAVDIPSNMDASNVGTSEWPHAQAHTCSVHTNTRISRFAATERQRREGHVCFVDKTLLSIEAALSAPQ